MQGWREDWLHRLTDCGGSEQRVFEEVAEIVRTIGFQYCSFGLHLPSVGREARDLWFTNYPQPWLQNRYFAHDFQTIDPVIKAALRSLAPVTWTEDHFDDHPGWEKAPSHGACHGWTLAMHGHYGETGLISYARNDPELRDDELDRIEGQLVWLSHAANGTIESIVARKDIEPLVQELTAREREVLRWTAAGKTSYEIGVILSISARTVNFHVTSILGKMRAVNKTQAVVKAVLFDLLG